MCRRTAGCGPERAAHPRGDPYEGLLYSHEDGKMCIRDRRTALPKAQQDAYLKYVQEYMAR